MSALRELVLSGDRVLAPVALARHRRLARRHRIASELAKQVRDHLDFLEGDPFAIAPAVAAMAALL